MKSTLVSLPCKLLLLALLTNSCLSWHEIGHFTVARIAKIHLQSSASGKQAFAWVNSMLAPFSEYTQEGKYPFVESATWPDRIQVLAWKTMRNWHFVDQTFVDPSFTPPQRISDPNPENVVQTIGAIAAQLSSIKGEQPGNPNATILGKSLSLRNLVHFLGDSHQPLHTVTRYAKETPSGDLGGNMFRISVYHKWMYDNLHFLWDHMMNTNVGKRHPTPLPDDTYDSITTLAESIIAQFKDDPLYLSNLKEHLTPKSWAAEGLAICENFLYKGLEVGQRPSDEYILKAKYIARRRIALAGQRLANLLEEIFVKRNKKLSKKKMLAF